MSDMIDPPAHGAPYPPPRDPEIPRVIPVRPPSSMAPPPPMPPRRRSGGSGLLVGFLLVALAFSLLVNFGLILLGAFSSLGDGGGSSSSGPIYERYHSGKPSAADKIAIVTVDGVLLEGLTEYAEKQIETAALDSRVKAVVLRIDSPGGSITASDDLHRRLMDLKNGKIGSKGVKKPLVVSMGSMAASGGYYIAMPGQKLYAERTTITGSIGVYAAFPNIKGLSEKYGFTMITIKAGKVKDSGSMFKDMSAQERQLWQEMVDNAYNQFIGIVEDGRPELKGRMLENVVERMIDDVDEKGKVKEGDDGKPIKVKYTRQRADGGIFTAQEAEKYGLIDAIGNLADAIKEAEKLAGPGKDYRVIHYEKPVSLFGALMGGNATPPANGLQPNKLSNAMTPRLWYLAPQSEFAGLLAAMNKD